MKSTLLILCILASGTAFGREVNTELKIEKGPFYVPVKSDVFNPLGSDLHSEAVVPLYLTASTIDFGFPSMGLFSLKSNKEDGAQGSVYFFARKGSGENPTPVVRVGFEDDKLTWFFSQGKGWSVKIVGNPQLEATPFSKMNDEQLLAFAKQELEKTDAGSLGDEAKITYEADGKVLINADVYQAGENDDDPVSVGKATITFEDKGTERLIKLHADVKDRN